MFKPLYRPYFLFSLLLYILVHLGRWQGVIPVEWINSYLTDLLCMPIILTICLVGVRFIKQIPNFNLTIPMIFGMTLFYSILFEFLLPQSNEKYTADLLDVVMYFLGAVIFTFLYQQPNNKNSILNP